MRNTSGTDETDILLNSAVPYIENRELEIYEKAADIPAELSEKEKKRILSEILREAEPSKRRMPYSIKENLGRVAVCFAALTALTFTCVAVEPLYEKLANAFLTQHDKYVSMEFEKNSYETVLKDVTYIPDGYTETERQELNGYLYVTYTNPDGQCIYFSRTPDYDETNRWNYDSEHYDMQTVTVRDIECILMIPEDSEESIIISWTDGGCVYEITAYLPRDEIIEMVSGIQ